MSPDDWRAALAEHQAFVRNVSFRDAVVHDVDFENCDLRGADFTNASVLRPKLKGAKLDGVRGLAP